MSVIIFPTDTVYGIGCSIYDKDSQLKIYKIKNRPLDKPLAVLCSSVKQIDEIAYIDENAKKIINKFLPGALTVIIKAKEDIVNITGLKTIGVRIPNYKIALNILEEVGPMTTTSVNESGRSPLNDYEIIKKEYEKIVDKIIAPNNEKTSNVSSTIVDLTTPTPKLIRQGEISFEEIIKCINV